MWGRRIRAALGMGLSWAVAWFAFGVLLARVPGFFSDLPFAIMFAPLGFLTGVIFSGVLVALASRRSFAQMSLARFAVWGGVSGLLLSGTFILGDAIRGAALGGILLLGPALAAAGAFCAAGSLALARRAERRELTGLDGSPMAAERLANDSKEQLGRGD